MRSIAFPLAFAVAACGSESTSTATTGLPVVTTGAPAGTTGGTPTGGTTTGATTGTPGGTTPAPIEIAGTWLDTWGTSHVIDDAQWSQQYGAYAPSLFQISQFDNAGHWAVAQNDAGNYFFAGDWSRFDWQWDGADVLYCQTGYAEPSEADALALPAADAADLMYGCGGFPWTRMSATP